jgi:uncharacterized protein (DUF2126 family)/transglutaminase-like putative cysteine protease
MAIRVALNHRTEYHYDRLVALGPQVVRLRPAPHSRTPICSYSMRVTPQSHFLNWQQDPHSNYLARLVFPEKTRDFVIEVDLVAEMSVINPFDFFLEDYAESYPFEYEPWLKRELTQFLNPEAPGPRLKRFLDRVDRASIKMNDFIVKVNRMVEQEVDYVIRLEPGVQTPEETLEKGTGSCRDSAWLLVQILRNLGLAARFVSGYLIQLTADVKALDGPSGPEADFTDLHAWTEVFLPGAGWVGLDPTSGLLTGEGHIPLACSPEPTSAAPITGAVDDCEVEFSHHMQVTRIHEDPRVTKPYTREQWSRIEALGHSVDQDLIAGDVRLTMGGEPTFVSIDDMDGDEWNTAALGPEKRRRAGDLLRRLRDRFSNGGFLHFGQGKWYPGEPLPRWALSCYWRQDTLPIWHNHDLVAADHIDYGFNAGESEAFVQELAQRLGVDPGFAINAYEDAWYYLWKERRLPVNVDPFDSNLDNEEDRARLAKVFEQGLSHVVGYALPLRRVYFSDGPAWESGEWFFRPERMYLYPGDSPMGLRLPLDSLPWLAPEEHASLELAPRDPFESRAALFDPSTREWTRKPAPLRFQSSFHPASARGELQPYPESAVALADPASTHVRTALCVEARAGRLHVFMPPVSLVEDYLELVHAIEATADHLDMPVQIEGYLPPQDDRLQHFKITPDPGVIEVNIHPSNDWDELVSNTKIIYEEARLARLSAEKFMLDGRHTGTGGGNHIVVGGPKPADSPILRRPDLLKSLVGYWHNHPSLSYIFSGAFVGPTSQAPRAEEAGVDATYELEIAFNQISDRTENPPWLVDRTLRNLLVDLTGNTHRSEFCIDKLFSPDSPSGRLGLMEFRAFEMPPHPEMSLTQHLLLRALIARFWRQPYRDELVRWKSELYDRFMLPHFVMQDLDDVLTELHEFGYPIEPEWFDPHIEFRFPVYGRMTHRGVETELRHAIEPWHVLGEEASAGGTARYVDSSLERMQVKVRGMIDPRHVLTCNGQTVPLHPTGVNGEFVAGVRYRAWQPPSCLHPTIPVHSPLVFDLVDTWNSRSIGGCTYHVVHPGGRSYEVFPVNAAEAESRRNSRFFQHGHTPGPVLTKPAKLTREYPLTLDLRQA